MKPWQVITLALSGVAVFIGASLIAMVIIAGPQEQDCYDWAQSDGQTESEATQWCHEMWNWGYDTSDITREEYDSNNDQLMDDRELMRKLGRMFG